MAEERARRPRARWYDVDGTQREAGGFATKKAAKAYEAKAKSQVAAGMEFNPAKGKVLFRDIARQWLAEQTKNVGNHKSILALAATRRGDMKTLGVDAVFGDVPLNRITRKYIQDWVNKLTTAGKKPSTVRHNFWTVRMVLEQAVIDGRLPKNPAEHVQLPDERGANGGKIGVVDRAQFLTPTQVLALAAATPWPYSVLVHVAPCSGLRAAELGGLQVQDVDLPAKGHGWLRVERTAKASGANVTQDGTTKTEGSNRRVPLDSYTTALLRDYLTEHPHGPTSDDYKPTGPLFPAFTLSRADGTKRPTGPKGARKAETTPEARKAANKARAERQAQANAALTVAQAEERLVLDWVTPLRHAAFYKAVYRPAVLRANAASRGVGNAAAVLPEGLRFHSLRHTYASLQAKVGTPVRQVAEWMGHANPITTETIYTHLYETDDHTEEMDAFGAMMSPELPANVSRLRTKAQ